MGQRRPVTTFALPLSSSSQHHLQPTGKIIDGRLHGVAINIMVVPPPTKTIAVHHPSGLVRIVKSGEDGAEANGAKANPEARSPQMGIGRRHTMVVNSPPLAIEAHLACPIGNDEQHRPHNRQVRGEIDDVVMAGLTVHHTPEGEAVNVASCHHQKHQEGLMLRVVLCSRRRPRDCRRPTRQRLRQEPRSGLLFPLRR